MGLNFKPFLRFFIVTETTWLITLKNLSIILRKVFSIYAEVDNTTLQNLCLRANFVCCFNKSLILERFSFIQSS